MSQYKSMEKQYKALANGKRLHILSVLKSQGTMPVHEIAKAVGLKVDPASKHIQRLYGLGFLERKKKGLNVTYRLSMKKNDVLRAALRLL